MLALGISGFTAAQAAQKEQFGDAAVEGLFTAAQAAQKKARELKRGA